MCPFLRLCSQITTLLHFNTTRLILWSLLECHRKEYFLTFQPLSFSKTECIIPRVYLPSKLTDFFEYLHSFCSKSPSLFLLHFQIKVKNPKYFSGIQMEQTILTPRPLFPWDSRQEVDLPLRLLLALGVQGFFVKRAKNIKKRMIMKKQYFRCASPEQFIRPREFGV